MNRHRALTMAAALGAAVALCFTVPAAVPPAAAADSATTVQCKDGTTAAKARHACRGHGGVVRAHSGRTTRHAKKASNAAATARSSKAAAASRSTPAAGGGSGRVWVNTHSKVYHCEGSRWYGKTKNGKYMSESAARAEGDRPDHGKGCS